MGIFEKIKNHKSKKQIEEEKNDEIRARREEYLRGERQKFNDELAQIPRIEIYKTDAKLKRRECEYLQISNITKKTSVNRLFPLVVIDTETTGLRIGGNDLLEVSAIKFSAPSCAESCFTTLLKPRNPIPSDATEINGITDEMVASSPKFCEISECFEKYISGCNVVGHNVSFDFKWLYCCGINFAEKTKFYDTLQLAKKLMPDAYDHKLGTCCDDYCIYFDGAHRSLSDAFATSKLFFKFLEEITV